MFTFLCFLVTKSSLYPWIHCITYSWIHESTHSPTCTREPWLCFVVVVQMWSLIGSKMTVFPSLCQWLAEGFSPWSTSGQRDMQRHLQRHLLAFWSDFPLLSMRDIGKLVPFLSQVILVSWQDLSHYRDSEMNQMMMKRSSQCQQSRKGSNLHSWHYRTATEFTNSDDSSVLHFRYMKVSCKGFVFYLQVKSFGVYFQNNNA